MTRLDRLDEQTRALVQAAAVIGTRVTYPVLAGVFSQAQQSLVMRAADGLGVDFQ